MARPRAIAAVALVIVASCGRGPMKAAGPSSRSPQPSQAQWTPYPAPTLAIGDLPQQASLYDVVVKEFVRLGWKTVCVDVMPSRGAASATDPPAAVIAQLKARSERFRPGSACRREGEDVVDIASGSKDGVAVTLVGADRDDEEVV